MSPNICLHAYISEPITDNTINNNNSNNSLLVPTYSITTRPPKPSSPSTMSLQRPLAPRAGLTHSFKRSPLQFHSSLLDDPCLLITPTPQDSSIPPWPPPTTFLQFHSSPFCAPRTTGFFPSDPLRSYRHCPSQSIANAQDHRIPPCRP
jgi:hypothetical protein